MTYRNLVFASALACSPVAVWACSTETIITQAQPGEPDGGLPPGDDDGGGLSATPDAATPPDRSVGGTWEKVTVHPPDGAPIEKFASIIVRGPSDVYAAEGNSNFGTGYYHYDGKAWTGVRYAGGAAALVALPSGELFGYGEDLVIKAQTGDAWERYPQPDGPGSPASIYSLWGPSRAELYASSNGGNVKFEGGAWSPLTTVDKHEGRFTGVSAKDIWFTSNGYGQLAHYDGASWTNQWDKLPADVTKSPTDGPYGVFSTGTDNVWVMGRRRTLVHYDGTAWRVVPGPDDEWGCDLTHGWASSKKNAWLVGKGGCVFHWDGTAWQKTPSGVTDDIYSIHGSDAEHVWIAPYSTTTVLRLKPE